MTEAEVLQLKKIIESESTNEFEIIQKITDGDYLKGFHEWVDYKDYKGAYKVFNRKKGTYWLVLVNWRNDDFYLAIFPENRKTPLMQLHKIKTIGDFKFLTWDYQPVKRDGRNIERKEVFKSYFSKTSVEIQFPDRVKDLNQFYNQIFDLTEARINSDEFIYKTEEDYEGINDEDNLISFPEGKFIEKIHLARERNSSLIKKAKQLFLQKHGRLFCEACNFDFKEKYGEIGDGFIEAHHILPLSETNGEQVMTRIEDLVMVCSNCHKMIHRRRPWLKRDELSLLFERPQHLS